MRYLNRSRISIGRLIGLLPIGRDQPDVLAVLNGHYGRYGALTGPDHNGSVEYQFEPAESRNSGTAKKG